MKTRHKTRQVGEVKQPTSNDGGSMTFVASTGAMDDEGDIIEQSGWTFADHIPFLFSHDGRQLPIGKVEEPRVSEGRLLVDVQFDSSEFAQEVKRMYRDGMMRHVSVGFDPIDYQKIPDDERGRYRFIEQKLKEVSAVNIGANAETRPLSKSFDPDVIPEQLQGRDAGPDETKEGRRNSKMDEAVQEHVKECAEYLKGDREPGDMKMCPFHKEGDHERDGTTAEDVMVEVDAEKVADLLYERLQKEGVTDADTDDDTPDTQGGDTEDVTDAADDGDPDVTGKEKGITIQDLGVLRLDDEGGDRSAETGQEGGAKKVNLGNLLSK